METGRADVAVETRRGSVGELHALDPFDRRGGRVPDGPTIWLCDFDAAALVLGSRQQPDLLDLDACAAAGVAVVRRRSGGGAVLLRPDDVIWIDLIVPTGFAPDDVRGSMIWVGRVWADALVALGAAPDDLGVHEGGMVANAWSELVCFAGIGPGEVLLHDRKLVGLSQRRTRHGIRVQGQLHVRPIVGETARYFAVEMPSAPLAESATLGEAIGGSGLRRAAELGGSLPVDVPASADAAAHALAGALASSLIDAL